MVPNRPNQTTTKRKLNQIWRKAIFLVIEVTKTIPTKVKEILLCLTPLDIYIREVGLRTVDIARTVEAYIHRNRLSFQILLQANMEAIMSRFVFDKLYRILTTYPIWLIHWACTRTGRKQTRTKIWNWFQISNRKLNGLWTAKQVQLTGVAIGETELSNRNIASRNIRIYSETSIINLV